MSTVSRPSHRRTLRQFEPSDSTGVLVTAVAGGLWAAALASAGSLSAVRSLVFLGTPLVLLSGLHARLAGYVHSSARIRLLPLPLAPRTHWSAALRHHTRGYAWAAGVMLGCAALGLGLRAQASVESVARLLAPLGWTLAIAFLIEPFIGAVAAFGGRRFAPGTPLHGLQQGLGGGWTSPEATVHLYGPALGMAGAAALAMPGLIAFEWLDDGRAIHPAAFAAPLVLALLARLAAPRLYARGLWQAVPFLAEATRTLAGPPEPEPLPRWVAAIRHPLRRLMLTQFFRLSPLPVLRLVLLIGWGGLAWTRAAAPSVPNLVVGAALAGLWLVPAGAVRAQRALRERLLAPLPTPRRDLLPPLLLLAPPTAVVLALFFRFGVSS